MTRALYISLALVMMCCAHRALGEDLVIGSKRFTESYILGEIATQIVRSAGQTTVHRQGMGNTAILFEALKTGQIHLYPDYSGTVARELLHSDATDLDALNRGLRPLGLAAGLPLGFENTYALAMREERANALGISRISDLAPHAELRLGLSHEFLQRSDGWPGLRARYALPQRAVGLDHGLAYEAIAPGQIDVMDIYSTDAKIGRYHLRVLVDDKNYFPRYDAVFVYRLDVPRRFPLAWAALTKLENSIDAQSMIAMNAKAELEGQSFADVAQAFVSARFGHATASSTGAVWWRRVFGDDFARLTVQHLLLVAVSLALAVLIGVPLGIWAARNEAANQAILAGVGVIQTVPALALLAFLIPVLGRIGIIPALVALFLYALLPIVRNTQSGLRDIAPSLRESAIALGLPDFARLRLIELPLAARAILSGIKTAAVISVGTATIAAFIGAGGYGERIVTGLALNDHALLLAGALPAALLALLVQLLFDLLDRWLISPGLRR